METCGELFSFLSWLADQSVEKQLANKYMSVSAIISIGVHGSLLDVVHIIVDVSSCIVVPENLSDGWIIDILHRHRHVCFRRTNGGDLGAGGRLLGSDPGQSNCQP